MSIANLRQTLQKDVAAYENHLDISSAGAVRRFLHLWLRSTFPVVFAFRLATSRFLPAKIAGVPLYKLARIASGIQIPRGTQIGGGLLLPHYGTIVINRHARIGHSCIILHNVTIGAKGSGDDRGVPTIGSNVYVGAGAVILGSVSIGDGAVVGASSVVVKDVPADSLAMGNPATNHYRKVIGKEPADDLECGRKGHKV